MKQGRRTAQELPIETLDWMIFTNGIMTGKEREGVFLDPPYVGTSDMYSGRLDVNDPANAVPLAARAWALRFGKFKHFRIAYCGYSHHHDDFFPRGRNGWIRYPWQLKNGMSKSAEDKEREVDMIWFSPHCLKFDNDIQD